MAETTLPVEHLFDVHLDVTIPSMIPGGPYGTRVTVQVDGGTFSGPRLNGTVVGPSADWAVVRPDGTLKLDVRVLLRTDDGADIYMSYSGIGLDGGARLRTAPQFETGDERYTWLNAVQAVGTGSSDGTAVDYQVYALA
jgi:Protein of unknown function (DUF3237)